MVRTIFKQWETTIIQFKIPDFQSGTLDSLVQESEELNKIDHQLGSSVNKVVEILNSINPQTSSGAHHHHHELFNQDRYLIILRISNGIVLNIV